MFNGKRIIAVMPAYNAGQTVEQTCAEVDREIIDEIILVDDASRDDTVQKARELNLKVIVHPRNRGYGGNQKTCYTCALEMGADIVVMIHPDYQYTPFLAPAMVSMIGNGVYDCVIASRIVGGEALKGGMPLYKYVANRFLTATQNVLMGGKLSEYHTGYRAFSREVLERLPLEENSEDFLFDNQMLSQIMYFGYRIGELSCPAKYFPGASSINFIRSCKYGLGCLWTAASYRLAKMHLLRPRIFDLQSRTLNPSGKAAGIDSISNTAGSPACSPGN